MNPAELYAYAARCAWEFSCYPEDIDARDRVERAWQAVGADYFATLQAVIAKADAEAGTSTSVYDAMVRVADSAANATDSMYER